jgi:hypothetical protein
MKKSTALAFGLAAALFAGQAMAEHHDSGHKGHKPGKMFETADTNNDGVVTKDEFHAQVDKMFAKIDTNGDGKITADEREAMKEQRKAKRKEYKEKKGHNAKTD